MTLAATLGANVRRHRLAAGWSVEQLAALTGFKPGDLAAIEARTLATVGLDDVSRLAQPFGAHPLDLLVDPAWAGPSI